MYHAADAHRTDLMTITRHVLNEKTKYHESRGDFSILLSHIVLGCKFVCTAVNKAGLAKLIGLAGETADQVPKKGKIYSVNEGNAKNWDGPTAKHVEKCKYPQDDSSPKSLRYIGSMVADVHQTVWRSIST